MRRWSWMCMVLLAWSVPAEAGKKGRKKARDDAPAAEQQPEVEAVPQAEIGSVEVTEGVGEVVGLPCLWEAGVGLSYATTWESTIGGELAVRTASTTHTEVLEQGPPTVLRYMGDPDVTMEGKEEAVAAMAAASEGVGEMPMELVVDGGILTGIRNMDALSEGLDRMVANMTVGQPVAGLLQPLLALGTVTMIGTVCTLCTTGKGLNSVTLVEVGSRPKASNGAMYAPGSACQ